MTDSCSATKKGTKWKKRIPKPIHKIPNRYSYSISLKVDETPEFTRKKTCKSLFRMDYSSLQLLTNVNKINLILISLNGSEPWSVKTYLNLHKHKIKWIQYTNTHTYNIIIINYYLTYLCFIFRSFTICSQPNWKLIKQIIDNHLPTYIT